MNTQFLTKTLFTVLITISSILVSQSPAFVEIPSAKPPQEITCPLGMKPYYTNEYALCIYEGTAGLGAPSYAEFDCSTCEVYPADTTPICIAKGKLEETATGTQGTQAIEKSECYQKCKKSLLGNFCVLKDKAPQEISVS
jgi:hypothetical protein